MSDALTFASPSPVVESYRDGRSLSAAALSLSEHGVASGLLLLRLTERHSRSGVARRLPVLAPADFCSVGRTQQYRAADDAAGARPEHQRR